MLKHIKTYFNLREIQARWNSDDDDIQYFILNDLLEVCVWTMNVEVRPTDGSETVMLDGVQPVFGKDLWPVLRTGVSPVNRFRQGDKELIRQNPATPFLVRVDDLLVTRVERDRFERENGFALEPELTASPELFDPLATFKHDATYAHVTIANSVFKLGALQGNIIKQLHAAAKAGQPWVHQDVLLSNTNAGSPRVVDLFKDRTKRTALLNGDGKGHFRLNLPVRPVTSLKRSAYSAAVFRGEISKVGRSSHPSHLTSPFMGR
ncbi:hypothetical protein [Devosia sp. 1566]|uniref:hypothetical protein n=1 Tax=Devosia sp. 1566 TaxID=2499144 RepID=UPI000FDC58A1|nr:hypothetical protein [Devosia sp. 1566]